MPDGSKVYGLFDAALGLWVLLVLTPATYVLLRTPLWILGTADRPDSRGRADAPAELGSGQGVRAVWPGPASIR